MLFRSNQVMAFLTVEDLVGSVEVIVFPRDYERNIDVLEEENKVFIRGKVDAADDRASKLICEKIWLFGQVPRELWIQFDSREDYQEKEDGLSRQIGAAAGKDAVVLYLKKERAMKRLPPSQRVAIDALDMEQLYAAYGEGNVKILEKGLGK